MLLNPPVNELVVAQAANGQIVADLDAAALQPALGREVVPAPLDPAQVQTPAPNSADLDQFYESSDEPPKLEETLLPAWAMAAMLAGCSDIHERRRRQATGRMPSTRGADL